MIIREARTTDIPSLLDFQLKMALETENVQLEILPLTQGVNRLFKDPSKGKYYVAEEEGEVVGCLKTPLPRQGAATYTDCTQITVPQRHSLHSKVVIRQPITSSFSSAT